MKESLWGEIYIDILKKDFNLEITSSFYKFKKKNSADYIQFNFINEISTDLDSIEINGKILKAQNAQIAIFDGYSVQISKLDDYPEFLIDKKEIIGYFDCEIDFLNKELIYKELKLLNKSKVATSCNLGVE